MLPTSHVFQSERKRSLPEHGTFCGSLTRGGQVGNGNSDILWAIEADALDPLNGPGAEV